VVDAFQFGFRTLLVADGCGDQEVGPHDAVLRDVGRRYADIVTVDEVVRWIDSRRGAGAGGDGSAAASPGVRDDPRGGMSVEEFLRLAKEQA